MVLGPGARRRRLPNPGAADLGEMCMADPEMGAVTPKPHQQQMIDLLNKALDEIGLSQAELARRTGHTAKHVNAVLTGHKTASPATLDYWAFTLGYEWRVEMRTRPDIDALHAMEREQ